MDAYLTAAGFDSMEIMNFYCNKLSNEQKYVIHVYNFTVITLVLLLNRNCALCKAACNNCRNAIKYIL